MPLRSMTGFGQAEKTTPSGAYRVEIRGVNNRFLEIQIRSPRAFANLEQRIKQCITESVSRGSLTVSISWERDGEGAELTWDREKVDGYLRIFKEINKTYKLKSDLTLDSLLHFSDFIKAESAVHDDETLWKHCKPVLQKAIAEFQKMREKEGAVIVREMRKMTDKLAGFLNDVESHAPERIKNYGASLAKRIESLAGSVIEPQRLTTEVALMADRLDISEECTRLKAHIEKYTSDFDATEPAGKRMTFLLQEMNREANTIGSKSNDSTIAHLAVGMKEIIEQMREQAQNFE